MKNIKNIKKRALLSALALSIGAAASTHAIESAIKDPLFSLKEIGNGTVLIAHGAEGKCGEGKCGEGKCGEGKSETKAKSVESKCGEGKCGVKKIKKIFKKKPKAKSVEAKCGEGKCGGSKAPEAKCGEGKCGSDKKN